MGRYETSIFDLIGLLIPLELAGVASVLAYQRAGWGGALLAPCGVVFLWFAVGAHISKRCRERRRPPA